MNVSATSLAPDSSVRKATPSDITERTARSGAVVETIFLSRPRRAQCTCDRANRILQVLDLPPLKDINNFRSDQVLYKNDPVPRQLALGIFSHEPF